MQAYLVYLIYDGKLLMLIRDKSFVLVSHAENDDTTLTLEEDQPTRTKSFPPQVHEQDLRKRHAMQSFPHRP